MDEMKVNVSVEEGIKELVIRTGDAIPVKEPLEVNIVGTLDAPFRYLLNRKHYLNIMVCGVTVDKEGGRIVLGNNEHGPYTDTIVGLLLISKQVTDMDLMSEKYRTPDDTATFLRRYKHYFASEAEYVDVFTALRTFRAKVEQQIASIKDDSGNFEQKRKQAVEHNIPKDFGLFIPIFKGTDKIEIKVEFIVNKTLDVAMYSTDLMQKLDQLREEIIDGVVDKIVELCPDLLILYK